MTEAKWKKVQPQIHDILAFTQTLGYLHCFHAKDIQLLLKPTTKNYLWNTTIPFESKHVRNWFSSICFIYTFSIYGSFGGFYWVISRHVFGLFW